MVGQSREDAEAAEVLPKLPERHEGGRMMEELREPTEAERKQDIKFLTHIIFEIRDYSRSAGKEPDETLKATAEWILALLKVATFNGSEGE